MYKEAYNIDWDKVNTVEDIKKVLELLEFTINSWHPRFSESKHLLKPKKQETLLGTWRNEFGET